MPDIVAVGATAEADPVSQNLPVRTGIEFPHPTRPTARRL
jgi:hypothetical protein